MKIVEVTLQRVQPKLIFLDLGVYVQKSPVYLLGQVAPNILGGDTAVNGFVHKGGGANGRHFS